MPASEEGASGQGRRVGCLQHIVAAGVDEDLLAPGEIAPEQEDYAFAAVAESLDDSVGECLPAKAAVRSCLARPDCQNGIQQEDALPGPSLQGAVALVYLDSQVVLDFLIYI